jgi:hypothetical protein
MKLKPLSEKKLVIGVEYRFTSPEDTFIGTYLGRSTNSPHSPCHEVRDGDLEYYIILREFDVWELTGLEKALL